MKKVLASIFIVLLSLSSFAGNESTIEKLKESNRVLDQSIAERQKKIDAFFDERGIEFKKSELSIRVEAIMEDLRTNDYTLDERLIILKSVDLMLEKSIDERQKKIDAFFESKK